MASRRISRPPVPRAADGTLLALLMTCFSHLRYPSCLIPNKTPKTPTIPTRRRAIRTILPVRTPIGPIGDLLGGSTARAPSTSPRRLSC